MNIKRSLFYLIAILFALPINAQDLTQTVSGNIKDANSKNPIPFAMVVLVGSNPVVGATADMNGEFAINGVPIGRQSFEFTAIGYESNTVSNVLVGSAKMLVLEIMLQEEISKTEVVTVKAKTSKGETLNNMTTASGRMFSVEEAKKMAGGFDDPARLASAFAGVSNGGVGNNGVVIRGNSPKGLLWRLEGVEISNPNHFADLDAFGGGGLTALSSYVLANSDFFTGAFPAEYGNAFSGVFDIKMRKGNNSQNEHSFELGAIGTDLASEGPISKKNKSSYIFNYRYSTLGLIAPVLPDGAGGIGYQDLSFKLHFPTKKSGDFSLWGLGALDKSGGSPVEDSSKVETYYDLLDGDVRQSMGAIGISHKYKLGKQSSILSSFAASGNGLDLKYDRKDFSKGTLLPMERIKSGLWNYSLQSNVSSKLSKRHTNKSGFAITSMHYNMNIKNGIASPGTLIGVVDEKGSSSLLRIFTSSKYRISNRLFATLGLNYQMFMLNENAVIEPRAGLKWSAGKKIKLGFAYGKHSRLERLNFYFSGANQVNKNLDFNKAHHFVGSFEKAFKKNLKLTIEPFYQSLFDVPVIENTSYSLINLQSDFYFSDTLINTGKGKNYGLDITLEKYLTKGVYYMVTASIFNSEYTGGDGVWRDTRFNKGFVGNFLIGKEWASGKNKNNLFGANLRATYQGGQRYTPVNEAATTLMEEIVEDDSKSFTLQRTPTLTMHTTLTYRKNKKKHASIWALKVLNLTGTEDFYGYEYNLKTGKAQLSQEAIFIPNLSYKIEF